MSVVKCLSVRQPWADLIASGIKTLEIRSTRTYHRGPVIIVSSLRRALGLRVPDWLAEVDGPRGVTIALADLVDCVPIVRQRTVRAMHERAVVRPEVGEFAWVLDNVARLPAVPILGQLGLFPCDKSLVGALIAAL